MSRVSTVSSIGSVDDDDDSEVAAPDAEAESSDEVEPAAKPTAAAKEKKKRLARLRRKSMAVKAYEFAGNDSDFSGIIFMEVSRITDLPPERNGKRPAGIRSTER